MKPLPAPPLGPAVLRKRARRGHRDPLDPVTVLVGALPARLRPDLRLAHQAAGHRPVRVGGIGVTRGVLRPGGAAPLSSKLHMPFGCKMRFAKQTINPYKIKREKSAKTANGVQSMSIASIPAVVGALDIPTISLQSANPSSPDYVAPPPPQPGPAPAKLPDIAYQASASGSNGFSVPGSATSQQLTAVWSTLLTLAPDSAVPLTTSPQPLPQPGAAPPTLMMTL